MSLVRCVTSRPRRTPLSPHSNLNDYIGLVVAQSAMLSIQIYKGPNDDGYGRLFSKASTAFGSGNSWEYVPATT